MPVISVRIDVPTYEKLRKLAEERGMSLYNYVRSILTEHVSSQVSSEVSGEVSSEVSSRILREVSYLKERIAYLERKLSEIETKYTISITTTSNSSTTTSTSGNNASTSGKGRGKFIEILAKRKIILLSEMRKVRNIDSLIAGAKRQGIVVIRGYKDIAFIHPQYWTEIKEKLPQIPKNIDEIENDTDRKTMRFLAAEALIYYDTTQNTWKLIEEPKQ